MTFKSLALAAVLILTGGSALAQPATPAPRDTVTAIAGQIRDLYFSAERGDAIADALEAEAASGRYDALTDPRDLAATLTTRLRPEDAHFNVAYDPNAPRGGPAAAGPSRRGSVDLDRISNYGFARVEVLPGNIGLIEMRFFANIDFNDPADPARRAADAALAMVANTDAVIFDVRNNGGGAPSMVGYLVSAFTPADADIYNVFHNREGTERENPGDYYDTPRLSVPLYVLTSGRTGSAAEAFPYTLQAADRATIVGEATGGAANPGGPVPVPGGFTVFISGGSPVNPITGRNWEGTGVIPDVETSAADALRRAQLLALPTVSQADPQRLDAVWAAEALAGEPSQLIDLADYAGVYGPVTLSVEDGRLTLRNARRPAVTLTPLGQDVFYPSNDPLLRYVFERDASGRVIAVEQRRPFGPGPRLRRE